MFRGNVEGWVFAIERKSLYCASYLPGGEGMAPVNTVYPKVGGVLCPGTAVEGVRCHDLSRVSKARSSIPYHTQIPTSGTIAVTRQTDHELDH